MRTRPGDRHGSVSGAVIGRGRIIRLVAALLLAVAGAIAVQSPALASSSRLCNGYAACSTNGYTTHGYQNNSSTSYWGMATGDECTNYAAFVESTVYHVATPNYRLGNAGDWAVNAQAHGVSVNGTPSVGAVAEWNGGDYGMSKFGHVAIVEQVGPSDSYIVISQQDVTTDQDGYDWTRINAGGSPTQWEEWPDNFIHFATPAGPPVLGALNSANSTFYAKVGLPSPWTAEMSPASRIAVADGPDGVVVGALNSANKTFYAKVGLSSPWSAELSPASQIVVADGPDGVVLGALNSANKTFYAKVGLSSPWTAEMSPASQIAVADGPDGVVLGALNSANKTFYAKVGLPSPWTAELSPASRVAVADGPDGVLVGGLNSANSTFYAKVGLTSPWTAETSPASQIAIAEAG